MSIKLKYKKPITPDSQLHIRFGYPIIKMKTKVLVTQDDYGADIREESEIEVEEYSIFLNKTKMVTLPLCHRNIEAINKLTKEIFVFANEVDEMKFHEAEKLFENKKLKKPSKPTMKKPELLEAKEL